MMRFALPVVLLLLNTGILALSSLAAAPAEADKPAPPGYSFDSPVDDKVIEQALFAAARQTLDAGHIFSKKDYTQQLQRIVASHKLPTYSEKELSGPEIYARAAKATLTLLVADEKSLRKHFIDPEDEEEEEEEEPDETSPLRRTSPIKKPQPKKGEGISFGTAFIISEDGIGVTNYHVLEHVAPCIVVGVDSYGKAHRVVEILAADKDTDIAVFRLAPGSYPYLPIRKDLPAGSPIYVFSHPGKNTNTFCAGVITRYAVLTSAKARKERKITWMSIDAVFAPGSSGGAILDTRGNAVGVVSFGVVIRREAQGMAFTSRYCVPAGMILRLIIPPDELQTPSDQFSLGTMIGMNQDGKTPQEVRQNS